MHGHPGGLHGGDESVVSGQDVGDLVVEALPVPGGHHVDEQTLGPPEAEALDEEEDPGSRATVPAAPASGISPGSTGRW